MGTVNPMNEYLLSKLSAISDPELGADLVTLGMIKDAREDENEVCVELYLTISGCPMRQHILESLRDAFPDKKVTVTWLEMDQEQRSTAMLRARQWAQAHAEGTNVAQRTQVLALSSGKGGVGKSTVSVDLASALSRRGWKVGLLDADIWGFSVPHLLGSTDKLKAHAGPDGRALIEPAVVEVGGGSMQVVSTGMIVQDESVALMWRGPMLAKALEQMLRDVAWDADLDYLIIDLPPGTGDVQMALSRLLPRAHLYVVTNPSGLSVSVAQRIGDMAQRSSMHVKGVVENMSYVPAGQGVKLTPFGVGGGDELSRRLAVPLVGVVPLAEEPDRRAAVESMADVIEKTSPALGTIGCNADISRALRKLML